MSEMNNKFVFVKSDERESEHIAAPKYSYWSIQTILKQEIYNCNFDYCFYCYLIIYH